MKSLSVFALILLSSFFIACNKDADVIAPVKYTGNILVNFNNYSDADGNGGYTKYETSLADSYQDVKIEVKLTNTTEGAPNDIYVYLTKVDALVTDYNSKYGTNLIPVSNTNAALQYDFSKPVVIKKGDKKATIAMKVNPLKFDLGKQNAIGIAILSVEGGAAVNNDVQGKLVIEFGARNQYDGVYSLKGAFYHPSQSPGYDPFTVEVEMRTTGANSVKMYWPDAGVYSHPGLFMGTLSYFGVQEPEYTIDPVTKKVTVQNTAPGAVTFYTMAPGYNSRYEAGPPKKIFAKFGYNYAAGPTFDPATNREWTDELTYLRPR